MHGVQALIEIAMSASHRCFVPAEFGRRGYKCEHEKVSDSISEVLSEYRVAARETAATGLFLRQRPQPLLLQVGGELSPSQVHVLLLSSSNPSVSEDAMSRPESFGVFRLVCAAVFLTSGAPQERAKPKKRHIWVILGPFTFGCV